MRSPNLLRNVSWILRQFTLYALISLSIFLMAQTALRYLNFKTDTQFLIFKQEYLQNQPWKFAFYVHAFTAFLTLFAGFTQFSSDLLKNHPRVHRVLGHTYVWSILLVNAPAAFIMGLNANGGVAGRAAFILLDGLWFFFTLRALVRVKNRNYQGHREDMIRSYALTFSAITLRTWRLVLLQIPWMPVSEIYLTEAWLGFVPNLVLVEIYFWRSRLATEWNKAAENS